MAFGGVDTGIMKPSEDDRAIPIATGIGLNPMEMAVPMAIGPMRLVAAVWEVSSESSNAAMQKMATKIISDG